MLYLSSRQGRRQQQQRNGEIEMKRIEILNSLGFNEITEQAIEALAKKTTKAAQSVIERAEESSHYMVFTDGERFTLVTTWTVTKEEQKQFAQILKQKYITAGTLADENGLWDEWRLNPIK
jgi:hypothetical protein